MQLQVGHVKLHQLVYIMLRGMKHKITAAPGLQFTWDNL